MRRPLIALCFTALWLAAATSRAEDFRIDEARSHADFGVRLLWLHTVTGRFTAIHGDVYLDRRGLATVDVTIDVNSVAMDSARFRRWVLAPEFFDAQHHPIARFLSEPVPFERLAAGGTLEGRLSLRGVIRPIRLELLPADCPKVTSGACMIEARGAVSRGDFGMTSHSATLSDQVKLDLQIALEPRQEPIPD